MVPLRDIEEPDVKRRAFPSHRPFADALRPPMPPSAPRPCPVCCAAAFRPAFRQHGHDFERCASCGFVRAGSPPDDAELHEHYRDDRSHGEQVYQEHDKFLARFTEIVAHIERHVAPGRFLDVGCSYGNALLAAQSRGWQVHGVELSRPAAEYGIKEYGFDIRMVPLHECGFAPSSFQAILMHHTLEHLRDPAEVVAQVRDLLAPGGIHFQALPNYGSLKRRMLGSCWGYGITPGHLVHFAPRTLRRLLERLGFEVLEWWTPSAREDPRFLWDVMRKLHLEARFMRKRGKPGQPFDTQEYLRFLNDRRWAHWVSNRAWPARLVRALRLGEEVFMVARKPGAGAAAVPKAVPKAVPGAVPSTGADAAPGAGASA
jgi:SAM-dependent methyltransferase